MVNKLRFIYKGIVFVPLYKIDKELQKNLEKIGLKFYEVDNTELSEIIDYDSK